MNSESIIARAAPRLLPDSSDVPTSIMWMPAGTHTISAWQAGQKIRATVQVDADTARVMNAALQAEAATGHRPLIDFDHEHKAAAAWPIAYRWVEGLGVMVDLEWSAAGRAAIQGKTHRAFSPEFFAPKGRVVGAPKFHGGLVNDPAFGGIAPIWASSSAQPQPNQKIMDPENTTGTQPAASAGAAVAPTETAALQASRAENEALRAQLAQRDQAITAARTREADQAIRAAVARGAIPAKDTAAQERWKTLLVANPDNSALLDSIPSNPAMQAASSATSGPSQFGVVGTPTQGLTVSDGLVEVLRAYQAKSSVDRSAIYGREISRALNQGVNIGPILAANSLGTLSADLVTQRALSLLKLSFPVFSKISTDFSSENSALNQTVRTRLRSVPATKTFVAGVGYGKSDAVATDVPLLIDSNIAVPLAFNVNELASTSRNLFAEHAEAAHYALGKALCDLLYAKITAGNFANVTTQALAGFVRKTVTTVGKKLNNRAVPPMARFSLLNSDYYEALISDPTIVNLATNQKAEVITENTLPRVGKFDLVEAVNLPTTGNLTGFFGTPDSLAIATRVPNDYTQALPGASHGSVSTVNNPDTGIAVQLVQYVNHDLAEANWRIAVFVGTGVGNAAAGERLVSA